MSKTLSTKTLKLNHPTCFLRSAHSHSFPTLCPSGKAAAVATAVAASRQALLGKEVVDCGVGDTGCHSSYITKKRRTPYIMLTALVQRRDALVQR